MESCDHVRQGHAQQPAGGEDVSAQCTSCEIPAVSKLEGLSHLRCSPSKGADAIQRRQELLLHDFGQTNISNLGREVP